MPLEVVLHAAGNIGYGFVIEAYSEYAQRIGVDADLDRRLVVGNLCFVPTLAPLGQIEALADFSFLRVARLMPRLRFLEPVDTVTRVAEGIHVALPLDGPVDPDLRIAVFEWWCTVRFSSRSVGNESRRTWCRQARGYLHGTRRDGDLGARLWPDRTWC